MDEFNMEHIVKLCSICFDREYDFCLDRCKDQFCIECFSRYVGEIVKNCWGLAVADIKCPSCFDHLEPNSWQKYVNSSVIKAYEKNFRPFKTLSRCCPFCLEDNYICHKMEGNDLNEREKIFRDTVSECTNDGKELVDKYQRLLYENDTRVQLIDIYNDISTNYLKPNLELLLNSQRQNTIITRSKAKRMRLSTESLSKSSSSSSSLESPMSPRDCQCFHLQRISNKIISLEQNAMSWNKLQFKHLSMFSRIKCVNCTHEFCFRCGSEWHEDTSCIDRMINVDDCAYLPSPQTSPSTIQKQEVGDLKNIKWKLENSKSCPQCFTLISREEGCNKVECTMCGYHFCWICMNLWSEKCGFYKCKSETNQEAQQGFKEEEKITENGVPDVYRIETKLSLHS